MPEQSTVINKELDFSSLEGIDESQLFLLTFDWLAN